MGNSNSSNLVPPNQTLDVRTSFGSGAEQDRYASHFSIGREGYDRVKEAGREGYDRVKGAVQYKSTGAEQDRYQAHFGVYHDIIRQAVDSIRAAGGELGRPNYFGLGYDGQQRAIRIAASSSWGAEQDRFGSHFGIDRKSVRNAAHDAAQSIKDGVNQATGRR